MFTNGVCGICEAERPDVGTVYSEGRLYARCPEHKGQGRWATEEDIDEVLNQPLELPANWTVIEHTCAALKAAGELSTIIIKLIEDPAHRWREGDCNHCGTTFRSRLDFEPKNAIWRI